MTSTANSRLATQALTRAQLKTCARELLLDHGYAATSIAQITHRAGFTTGAYYSNFANKAELTLELLSDLQAETQQQLEKILAVENTVERIGALHTWVEETLTSGWPRLELEFALASRGDSALVDREGERNRDAARNLESSLERLAPALTDGPVPIRRIAEIILDIAYGLAVRKIIDPQVTADHLFQTIYVLAAAVGADAPSRQQ
ncbi:TetR/AcrR family transcriptional regulator [Rhodococcus sp. G-MC3]|uniref:TetR/AcrR family transcriptional regulator n=1 Tax=Rhodococcus sp. G-MC3 TaxID=3046209 RepID=UPI0024B89EF1|nr:TetR/AcrR family transcriptional regulator [Rhodococcus sp. G-MC3]MDJ0392456.1 TetR/AcrR family transcriptional regulator [Rhodococcus sp. G-MC3]